MKTCTKCQSSKEDDEFNWRSKKKGTRQSICKICQSLNGKKHYKNNSDCYKQRAKEYRIKLKERFSEWLSDKSCIDCGEKDPIVLDCDHVRDQKKFNISEMLNDARPWELILEELAKCEIRCANCHRRKTAKQFSWKFRK